jgi:hypothetical protein
MTAWPPSGGHFCTEALSPVALLAGWRGHIIVWAAMGLRLEGTQVASAKAGLRLINF